MNRNAIQKIAQTPEERVLLAKIWDKINIGMQKNIPCHTGFLSLREQEMAQFLFGHQEGLFFFGGYTDAERKQLIFLPEYLDKSFLYDETSPIQCFRAKFFTGESPSHRDFLGALMGAGITRETVGDILVSAGSCDFFTTSEIASYVLQNFTKAGRTHITLEQISLSQVSVPEAEIKEIKDTVSSTRLDCIAAAGFRMSRSAAVQIIHSGRTAVNGIPCDKPDKIIEQGNKITVRGQGKISLHKIGNETKKGRISVLIHRYI